MSILGVVVGGTCSSVWVCMLASVLSVLTETPTFEQPAVNSAITIPFFEIVSFSFSACHFFSTRTCQAIGIKQGN